jgi:heme exporter protein D
VRPYLWWWAFLLAVIVISAEFGASGSTRFILEIAAGVVFIVVGIVVEVMRRVSLLEKERRRRDGED